MGWIIQNRCLLFDSKLFNPILNTNKMKFDNFKKFHSLVSSIIH
jgi:hypothetical protein